MRSDFTSFQQKVDSKFKEQDEKIKKLEDIVLHGAYSGGAGAAAGPGGKTRLSEQHTLPLGRRRVVFVGGFGEDIDAEEVKKCLRAQTATFGGIEDVVAIGNPSNKGKIIFDHCDDMWNFLRGMKGKKLEFKGKALFHSIDKSRDEQTLSRRVYHVVKAVRDSAMVPLGLTDQDWWQTIKHNDVAGLAWIKLSIEGETKNVKIVQKKATTLELEVGPSIMQYLARIGGVDLAAVVVAANGLGGGGRQDEEMV